MKRNLLFVLIITMVSALFSQQKNLVEDVNIPYEMFTLENGLTVIVHEDHKAPIVAVNVWYHVGSKNEKQGKTGFAHLFEHLMFNGSENFNDDYFKTMERIGATDMNGTTNEDRTNYFQNVPKNALDVALWMESDRMGHLLGAISQGKLDEQRGVVQNEKRQGENEPYSVADELTTKATWPAGHPYSWTVIGSMEDLNAASLDDVKEWFKTYYGAANAVVSLAGDIDVKTAKEKMQKYFGDIPSGPPVAKYDESIAKRTGTIRQTAEDRVPQARLYKVWNVPKWASTDIIYLDLLSDVLTSGKTSRLYKKLVYDKKIATNVSAYIDAREIAGQFSIVVTAKPGIALSEIESVVDSELKEIFEKGPSTEELQRVKINAIAGFIRGIERIGGFGGKSDILAQGMVYGGTPDYYKTRLKVMNDATAADLKNAGQKWLSDGQYVLEIIPFPAFKNEPTDSTVRKNMPSMSEQPPAQFPNVERAALSNGLKILLAERHSVPVVNFNLQVDAGYAADQFILPGTASFTLDMMDEGTKTRNALQISDELAMLGANLSTGANSDNCIVTLSSLKANLDKSLNIFADVILNPSFPKEDIERIRQQRLAGIQREKVSPIQMALRVFPKLLYGEHHAYGTPLTGSGNEQSVSQIKREDLEKFHSAWFKPNNATLIVVGDITMKELKPMLEKLFKAWKPGDVQKIKISEVKQKEKSTVFIVNKPGALQSIIFAGNITVPTNNKDELAIQAMNKALGGMFTSRMNMNLREDKHWSYGAQTLIFNTKGERPFITYAAVQTDKTKESMVEVKKELSQIISDKPVTQDEFNTVQTKTILELSGMWETNNAVMGSLSNINRFGYPDDYYSTYAKKVAALKYNDVKNSAKEVVYPNQTVWVIVGDRAKIEQGIKDLNFGEVKYLDADGNDLSTINEKQQNVEINKK
ncbi:MAG: insulinase family protein [Bacteroidetes bacterium]|nr:insulinase family protein [Bacteroidota bacterium]